MSSIKDDIERVNQAVAYIIAVENIETLDEQLDCFDILTKLRAKLHRLQSKTANKGT